MMDKREDSICLETGANELQVLEFVMAGNHFGMNVTKVKEMARYKDVQRVTIPQPCVEGTVQSRGGVYTVVDLAKFMGFPDSEDPEHDMVIITDFFNRMNVALHVHQVDGIRRIALETVEKPDSAIHGDREGIVTGIARLDDRSITLIDCEKITFEWKDNELGTEKT